MREGWDDIRTDLAEALSWAVAEIEGRARYESEEQRERCLERAARLLTEREGWGGVDVRSLPVKDD